MRFCLCSQGKKSSLVTRHVTDRYLVQRSGMRVHETYSRGGVDEQVKLMWTYATVAPSATTTPLDFLFPVSSILENFSQKDFWLFKNFIMQILKTNGENAKSVWPSQEPSMNYMFGTKGLEWQSGNYSVNWGWSALKEFGLFSFFFFSSFF